MSITNHPNRSRNTISLASSPTPSDVSKLRCSAGLTQAEAARMVFSSERSWQNWEADTNTAYARRMHPAIWILFQLVLNELTIAEVRKAIAEGRKRVKP